MKCSLFDIDWKTEAKNQEEGRGSDMERQGANLKVDHGGRCGGGYDIEIYYRMEELLNCRLSVCQGKEEGQQMLQERIARQYNQLRKQKNVTQLGAHSPRNQQKEVFSFRHQQLPPSEKHPTRNMPLPQQVHAPPPTAYPTLTRIPHSPQPLPQSTRVRFFHSPPPTSLFVPPHRHPHHPPRSQLIQRSAIYDSPSICEGQPQRLTFKRLRISEEETEYSSKQSQIGQRGRSDAFEVNEQSRRNECARTKTAFLQLSSESSKSITSPNKLTHSDFLLTQPRCHPPAPSQNPTPFAKREIPSTAYPCSENADNVDRKSNQMLSLVKEDMAVELPGKGKESRAWTRDRLVGSAVQGDETSRTLIDCFKEQPYLEEQAIHQIHFQSNHQCNEPTYSHQQQTYHNGCEFPQNHANSSIKAIIDNEKQRKRVTFQPLTPFNSSASIHDTEPQQDIRSPFARTNNIRYTQTIQSFGSYSSDISSLDTHFMQNVGVRQGVTRLT